MKLINVLVPGALALSLLAQPAMAETATRSIAVRTADLNLRNMEGRATLDARIHAAAKAVCAPVAQQPIAEQADYRNCLAAAIGSVQPQVTLLIAEANKSETPARG